MHKSTLLCLERAVVGVLVVNFFFFRGERERSPSPHANYVCWLSARILAWGSVVR